MWEVERNITQCRKQIRKITKFTVYSHTQGKEARGEQIKKKLIGQVINFLGSDAPTVSHWKHLSSEPDIPSPASVIPMGPKLCHLRKSLENLQLMLPRSVSLHSRSCSQESPLPETQQAVTLSLCNGMKDLRIDQNSSIWHEGIFLGDQERMRDTCTAHLLLSSLGLFLTQPSLWKRFRCLRNVMSHPLRL